MINYFKVNNTGMNAVSGTSVFLAMGPACLHRGLANRVGDTCYPGYTPADYSVIKILGHLTYIENMVRSFTLRQSSVLSLQCQVLPTNH